MKKTFTHIVLIGTNLDSIVKFSDFETVEDFKNYLNENGLRYDMEDGVFVSDNDDIAPAIYICEKAYYEKNGYLADWDHCGLSDYLNNRESGITWSEESESVWSAYGSSLYTESENVEKIFSDLKAIDGVEIEIELDEDYEFGYEEKSTPTPPSTPPTPSCDEEPEPKKRRVRRSYYRMLIDMLNDKGIKEVILDTPVDIDYVVVHEKTDYGFAVRFKTVSAQKISLEPNPWGGNGKCPIINGEYNLPDLSKDEYYEIVNQIKKKKSKK